MKIEFSEQEMVLKFCSFLQKEKKNFAVEVPFFSRSIDLVFTEASGELNAVEFKLRNWKKAIIQAKCYMLGADFTYICLPSNMYTPEIEEEIFNHHCGVILFDAEKEEFNIIKKFKKTAQKGRFLMKKGFEYAYNNKNYEYLLSLG